MANFPRVLLGAVALLVLFLGISLTFMGINIEISSGPQEVAAQPTPADAGLPAATLDAGTTADTGTPPVDSDKDGVIDSDDNCLLVANPDQANSDGDALGDLCDTCPLVTNEDQVDTNGDGIGDVCVDDEDGDGTKDAADNCPKDANTDQANSDNDTLGDACDNCPAVANNGQEDADRDGIGDVCPPLAPAPAAQPAAAEGTPQAAPASGTPLAPATGSTTPAEVDPIWVPAADVVLVQISIGKKALTDLVGDNGVHYAVYDQGNKRKCRRVYEAGQASKTYCPQKGLALEPCPMGLLETVGVTFTPATP